MITITLRLSESLLCIFRDNGDPRPESCKIQVAEGTTVKEILAGQHISPLLVPMISFKSGSENRRLETSAAITSEGVLTLYGPLAGG
ncbi:MAG: hypothetical protein HUN04_18745 [Desulfobacter sp.]|nr:MAG: hypothetical protein HUN04_18745 [Desulfobacter sp.]